MSELEELKKEAVERIYLIPDRDEGRLRYVWCDDPAPDYGSATVSQVASIYDGDTITVTVDEWPGVIGERIKIRIAGIQAPERRSRCDTEPQRNREKALASDARIYLVEQLRAAGTVELHHIERGSFFRIADGRDLGAEMLARGLAIPYVEGKGGGRGAGGL